MIRRSIGTTAALATLVILLAGWWPQAAQAQWCELYTENFGDGSISDFDNGTYKVQWCPDGASIRADSYCTGQGSALQANYDSTDPVIWVFVDTQNCTQVRLEFDYSQYSANLTGTVLRYKLSTDTVKNCPTSSSGFTAAQNLDLAGCNHVSYTVNVAGNRSVYFMLDHGTPSNTMITIDNIVVSLSGCACDPGPNCVTDFAANFGTTFQSGSVCSRFPDLFPTCEGNGPYLSTGTACGGIVDCVMSFGTGYPYSAAVTRCLDLAGLTAAHVEFAYTKTDQTLGPQLYASTNGTTWTSIWTAPFSFQGGCASACVDLAAYAGQSEVYLKLSSGTSGTQAHAIDEILLVRGAACPVLQACCLPSDACADLAAADCAAQGGTSLGAGTTCASQPDTDSDGIRNACDNCPNAANPGQEDHNTNGVGDACDYMPGDTNCDGVITYGDINPFVLALSDQSGYAAQYPYCNYLNADTNNDGQVTYGDINPFVTLLGTR